MIKRIFCAFFIALFLLGSFSFADSEPRLIKKILIQGNERTREIVIRGIIRTSEGDIYDVNTVAKIQRYLDNQRKFSYVKVSSIEEKDGAVILIDVKDKWSIVPVPYYSNQQGDQAFGAAFLESNFLGFQNILLFSVVHEFNNWNGTFLYSHPRVLGSRFSYTALANKTTEKIYHFEGTDRNGFFFRTETGGDVNLKYQFHDEHYFMVHFFTSGYKIEENTQKSNGLNNYVQLFLELDWTHYDGIIGRGSYLGLYYEKDFLSDTKRTQIGAKGEHYLKPGRDQNIYLNLNYFYCFEISRYFEERLGGNPTSYNAPLRGYETMQIPAKHAISATGEYRVSVLELFSVDLSLVPFVDLLFSSPENNQAPDKFDCSTGLGFRFYFKEVLVPAAQAYFGYSIKNKDYSIGLTVGTKF